MSPVSNMLADPSLTMPERKFFSWARSTGERAEWVDGKVIVQEPVTRKHVQLTGWIQTFLLVIVQHQKLGEVFGPQFAIRLRKGEQSLRVPDVMFVSTARATAIHPKYLDGAPDLAIEVVSPDSVARDWRDKYLAYEAAGVREYWIIDPLSKTMEVYALRRKRFHQIAASNDGKITSTVISSFQIHPDWLWRESLPSVIDILGLKFS